MSAQGAVLALTPRQRDVLRVLTQYTAAVGEAPPLRYVARRLGLHHSRVAEHLRELHRKGWLRSPTTDGLHCTHEPEDLSAD